MPASESDVAAPQPPRPNTVVPTQSTPADVHEQIGNRLRQLQPWRMNIQITPQINTGDFIGLETTTKTESVGPNLRDRDREKFLNLIDLIFPEGLYGKRFLDCGCNAGGCCFWVRERKAEIGYGFDAREHWIKQARFIKNHRTIGPTDRLQFEVLNLYDLPIENLHPFDIVQFKGLFHQLPDPISGLRVAADLSRDLLIFSSAFIWGQADGSLEAVIEEPEQLHGALERLTWYPTGPRVCAEIIRHLGFEEIKLTKMKQIPDRPTRGRLEIVAARRTNRLDSVRGELV